MKLLKPRARFGGKPVSAKINTPPGPTPSMDDKNIPSPPTRTVDQYEADKAAGINPVGFNVQEGRK